jgi:hypothetical protein
METEDINFPKIHFRSKYVCMNRTDWKAFAATVMEANPGARYLRSLPSEIDLYSPQPPDFQIEDSFTNLLAHEDPPWEITMHIDPAWQWSWARSDIGRWYTRGASDLVIRFILGGKVFEERATNPTYISQGEIDVSCRAGRKDHYAFAQRLFRLLKRFVTNKNQVCYGWPGYEVRWTREKGNWYWLGHDAIRWAREDKRRLLTWHSAGWGVRPNDEGIVKPPQNPH